MIRFSALVAIISIALAGGAFAQSSGGFQLERLHPDVRAAVERARQVQSIADDASDRGFRNDPAYHVARYGSRRSGRECAIYHNYSGEWARNLPNGYGEESQWESCEGWGGSVYSKTGQFVDGVLQGFAVYDNPDEDFRYEGEFRAGSYHGFGALWSGDGEVQQAGVWNNGALSEPLGQQGAD